MDFAFQILERTSRGSKTRFLAPLPAFGPTAARRPSQVKASAVLATTFSGSPCTGAGSQPFAPRPTGNTIPPVSARRTNCVCRFNVDVFNLSHQWPFLFPLETALSSTPDNITFQHALVPPGSRAFVSRSDPGKRTSFQNKPRTCRRRLCQTPHTRRRDGGAAASKRPLTQTALTPAQPRT